MFGAIRREDSVMDDARTCTTTARLLRRRAGRVVWTLVKIVAVVLPLHGLASPT